MKEPLLRREGFWRGKHGLMLELPWPRDQPTAWLGRREFLAALKEAEARAMNLAYKGGSDCRLCGKPNGSVTFRLDGWEWPSGFAHYVRKHNVRPSLAFQEFIIGRRLGQ